MVDCGGTLKISGCPRKGPTFTEEREYSLTLTVDSVQVIHKRRTTSNETLFPVIRKRGTTSNETLCVLSDIIKWLYILFGLFGTVLTHK